MAIKREDADKLFIKIQKAIGSETLALDMYLAMPTSFANEVLKYIAKNHEII